MKETLNLASSVHNFSEKELNVKCVNYIYGSNGSGKSQLCKIIEQEYETENKRVFNFSGYENLLNEHRNLNTLTLGVENIAIDVQIENLKKSIKTIEENLNLENDLSLAYQNQFYYNELEEIKDKLEKFKTKEARKIQNFLGNGIRFNKTNLNRAIQKNVRLILSESDLELQRLTVNAVEKGKIANYDFFDLEKFISLRNSTIDLLLKKTKPSDLLFSNPSIEEKLNFARIGFHLHEEGDECNFCGNRVSKERLDLLDHMFSENVREIEKEIDLIIREMNEIKNYISNIDELDVNMFFEIYHDRAKEINRKIKDFSIAIDFEVYTLLIALQEKKNNIFKPIEITGDFNPDNALKDKIDTIIHENNVYGNDLKKNLEISKEKIINHFTTKIIDGDDYKDLKKEIKQKEIKFNKINNSLKDEENNKSSLETEIYKLREQYSSNGKAIENINRKLSFFSSLNFKLALDDEVGQYFVINQDYTRRNIDSLSEGEKNVIAFLWFIESLESIENQDEKIVLFDDPMSSNDSNYQYLMIGEIKNLVSKRNNKNILQIFILSHNQHFYTQVINQNKYKDKKNEYNYIHLRRKTSSSEIKYIKNKNEDLRNLYESLWTELKLVKDEEIPLVQWNIMRRILETFVVFKYSGDLSILDQKINNHSPEHSALYKGLIKSLHVNSHLAFSYEDMDISGMQSHTLFNQFEKIFEILGDKEHHDCYMK